VATVCLGCGAPTLNGTRCPRCAGGYRLAHGSAAYSTPAYVRMRKRLLAEHRRTVGPVCPRCWRREDGSVKRRLTLDHTIPIGLGGDVLGPTTVCCTSCNAKQAHVDRPELSRGRRVTR
jgi:hypothetical protein